MSNLDGVYDCFSISPVIYQICGRDFITIKLNEMQNNQENKQNEYLMAVKAEKEQQIIKAELLIAIENAKLMKLESELAELNQRIEQSEADRKKFANKLAELKIKFQQDGWTVEGGVRLIEELCKDFGLYEQYN